MSINRRQFMRYCAQSMGLSMLAACQFTPGNVHVVSQPTASSNHNPLWIPPTISGTTIDLTIAKSSTTFINGATTATYSYNAQPFWGPTIILNQHDTVTINVTNQLAEATTTHWHGIHLPAEMDGGPHQPIAAGATWSPTFTVNNDAATYWYHPHLHSKTMEQLNYGAGGLIIVNDAHEASLPLPRTYGSDDIPLVLTSRRFLDNNAIDTMAIYGDVLLSNGTSNATIALPAQYIRIRLLNAEVERSYNLGFHDDRTFYVIASDGGLLNAPVPVTRLPLAVGERYEILVDLQHDPVGSTLEFMAYNEGQLFGFPGGENARDGEFGSLLNNTNFPALHISVIPATPNAILTLPATLAQNTRWQAHDATKQRTIAITDQGPGTPFTFDNHGYDMQTINHTITRDSVEQWTIVNGHTFDHAFHIHDVQFAIVSRSSGPVPAYEQGWKDTLAIAIDESVSFVAQFSDYANPHHPYMYHCHMANHEDGGLMGQFLVVE